MDAKKKERNNDLPKQLWENNILSLHYSPLSLSSFFF